MPWKPKAIVLAAFAVRLLSVRNLILRIDESDWLMRSRAIPPTLTRLTYLKQALTSRDWSYARVDVVILTQVSMHISIILATVPCIRPWLIAFESGGLHAPSEVRRESRHPPKSPKLAPLLPIALPPATSDDPIALEPGSSGHRKRVEAWPVQWWADDDAERRATVTFAEHDPIDAKEAARKRSMDSVSSKGITRTKSSSIAFEDIQQDAKQPIPESSRPRAVMRTMSYHPELADVEELLGDMPRAKHKQRIGSVGSF